MQEATHMSKQEEPIVYVRARISQALHHKAKMRAAKDRVDLTAIVNLALEQYLSKGGAK